MFICDPIENNSSQNSNNNNNNNNKNYLFLLILLYLIWFFSFIIIIYLVYKLVCDKIKRVEERVSEREIKEIRVYSFDRSQ